MKALVLGCGSIGLRHIAHLRQLGLADVEAADPNLVARERAKAECGLAVQPDPEKALGRKPDIVLVCTPASTHVPVVMKALDAGAHVFVEKPLSTSLEGIDALLERVQADGRTVQVGYQLRYHPAMRKAKSLLESGRLGEILAAHAEFGLYLPKWWPSRDYRDSYMATTDLGGGLLLDVSHEIDLLIWFLGAVKEVSAYGERLSTLEIKGPDVIKVLMKMASGTLVSLNIDCLQPTYTRGYRLAGEGTALRWDCPSGRADSSLGRLWMCDRKSDRFQRVRVQGSPQNAYLDELRDFLSSVTTGRPPAVGVREGAEVLRVAMAVQQAMQGGRSIRV